MTIDVDRLSLERLEDVLSDLPKEKLANILARLADMSAANMQAIAAAVGKQKPSLQRAAARRSADERASSLLAEIEDIASEFNEYGGGPREDEERVCGFCRDLQRLLEKQAVSPDIRAQAIESILEQVVQGNSGVDDLLTETAFWAAKTRDDWRSVIEKLEPLASRKDSGYHRNMVMHLYLDKLGDEETYLRMRQAHLRFGSDYYDLVQYWKKNGNHQKAMEVAREGLKMGEGRLDELRVFLEGARGRRGGRRD